MNAEQMEQSSLNLSPVEVAERLGHLSGLVFFDSSGNFPTGYDEAVSIVAAQPTQVLRGRLDDVSELQQVLNQQRSASQQKFPDGGLCGWVEYEGSYCFGVYPEMLVYRHRDGIWFERGNLSSQMQKPDAYDNCRVGEFTAEMSEQEYLDRVRQVKDYIVAGDIYQVNLTQMFHAHCEGCLFPLYRALRQSAPAPLAGYFSLAGREVLSSSPETLLKISGQRVETRPIKGTRPRFQDPAEDMRSACELRTSEKEVAELVMITDLERNDLGQVCDFGSVRVEEMLKLEKLEHVFHLVSTVTGQLRDGIDTLQALQACFPGGSITGAPKKRAMEVIEELERVPRGLYTGAMGYLGFNGESQFNVVIRTLVRDQQTLQYHVGAGIVADSDPQMEYQETLQKARGIRRALADLTE